MHSCFAYNRLSEVHFQRWKSTNFCPLTCSRYTMLLGRPPFETTNLKETYKCIREARYSLPSSLSPQAKQLIANLLAKIPEDRPNLDHILRHDFFTQVRRHFHLPVCLFPSQAVCLSVNVTLYEHNSDPPSHQPHIDPLLSSTGLQSRASAG